MYKAGSAARPRASVVLRDASGTLEKLQGEGITEIGTSQTGASLYAVPTSLSQAEIQAKLSGDTRVAFPVAGALAKQVIDASEGQRLDGDVGFYRSPDGTAFVVAARENVIGLPPASES